MRNRKLPISPGTNGDFADIPVMKGAYRGLRPFGHGRDVPAAIGRSSS
jgi:hypothetical protein